VPAGPLRARPEKSSRAGAGARHDAHADHREDHPVVPEGPALHQPDEGSEPEQHQGEAGAGREGQRDDLAGPERQPRRAGEGHEGGGAHHQGDQQDERDLHGAIEHLEAAAVGADDAAEEARADDHGAEQGAGERGDDGVRIGRRGGAVERGEEGVGVAEQELEAGDGPGGQVDRGRRSEGGRARSGLGSGRTAGKGSAASAFIGSP
jgi:hypothetical protein